MVCQQNRNESGVFILTGYDCGNDNRLLQEPVLKDEGKLAVIFTSTQVADVRDIRRTNCLLQVGDVLTARHVCIRSK